MREGVLVRRRQLGERPAVAFVGYEHRVVAESFPALRLAGDRSVDIAERGDLATVGEPGERDGGEAGGAVTGIDVAQQLEQLRHVAGVGGVVAGEARRTHAGCAAERVDLEPRVVGDRREPGGVAEGDGLQARVVLERGAGLLDVGHAVGPRARARCRGRHSLSTSAISRALPAFAVASTNFTADHGGAAPAAPTASRAGRRRSR